MNEDAQKVLTQLLEKAISGIDSAVAFSQEQIPDVVHQLLMWEMYRSALFFTLSLMVFVGSVYFFVAVSGYREKARIDFKNGEKWTKFGNYSSSVEYDFVVGPFIWLAPAFLMFISLVCTLSNLTWLKIIIAPKLYLLEYAAKLVS